MIVILVIVALLIIGGGAAGGLYYISHNSAAVKSTTTTQNSPTAPPANASPTQGTTAAATGTPAATATTSGTVTSTATAATTGTTTTSSNSYSATQPGPGCDPNGGTWTPQAITSITCGTQLTINSASTLGYLYFQLPNNQAFSTNNRIGVTGAVQNYSDSVGNCAGLAEQNASGGYLVEYCGDGRWYIDSISSTGGVVQILAKNVTSTRTNEMLSLDIHGTTLTFTIDTETHTVTIPSFQPTKVAITYFAGSGYENVTVSNFTYTAE